MAIPRAVVVPFGVPAHGRGLGLGMAALVQSFVRLEGEGVGIAQLHAQPKGEPIPVPLEAFVTPEVWRDIAGRGDAPNAVSIVVTGAFEPPAQGAGALHVMAFDAQDGKTRVRVDVGLDEIGAGALLVSALEELGSGLGAQLGPLGALRDLDWGALESVLHAERCAMHDPVRGGPQNGLAALAHLGRAIQDAPAARYAIERLASFAVDGWAATDGVFASAASRTLERAIDDAPEHVELVESLALLELRVGRHQAAERRLNAAIARSPRRARLYTVLAQSLRAQNKVNAALATVDAGREAAGEDLLLSIERGAILAAGGDAWSAVAAWREALARDPVHPLAFVNLAGLALQRRDAELAAPLVDAALAAPHAHPDVLRHAVKLALASEATGLPRAARVARLCSKLLEIAPRDAWASLAFAEANLVLGDASAARARLADIERHAPGSAPASEAQVLALSIDDPSLGRSLESLMRAAQTAPIEWLEDVSARARKLGTLHSAWPGWVAAGVAERRRERLSAAQTALEVALELAPGAPSAHIELAAVLLARGDPAASRTHAQRAIALEGETPRALLAWARALFAEGQTSESRALAARILTMQPENEEAKRLAEQPRSRPRAAGWVAAARRWWTSK